MSKEAKRTRMAEREGFEPSVPFWGTHAFQAGAIGHSATSPKPTSTRIANNYQEFPFLDILFFLQKDD